MRHARLRIVELLIHCFNPVLNLILSHHRVVHLRADNQAYAWAINRDELKGKEGGRERASEIERKHVAREGEGSQSVRMGCLFSSISLLPSRSISPSHYLSLPLSPSARASEGEMEERGGARRSEEEVGAHPLPLPIRPPLPPLSPPLFSPILTPLSSSLPLTLSH
eukprot:6179245-Pleurochrysis_carterae.AAC.2